MILQSPWPQSAAQGQKDSGRAQLPRANQPRQWPRGHRSASGPHVPLLRRRTEPRTSDCSTAVLPSVLRMTQSTVGSLHGAPYAEAVVERRSVSDGVPFHRPAIGNREIAAAVEVLRSGWLTTGPRVHTLEAEFAERVGVRHAAATSSATAALHLALDAFGVAPGDEVVVPTYTFTACGEVCAYVGAKVVLSDVGADALIGPAQLERVVTPRTRVVMPVHFAGQAVDVDALRPVAPDARFLEDAAHALPADVRGVSAGRLGDAAAFSFYATKTMTTGGEGGMLVTNDDAVAERVRVMRLHGISSDAWNRYGAGGNWAYQVEEAGFKYNLTDLAAAIGLVQLDRLDELADARAAIAARYDAAFANSPYLETPPRRDGDQHAWHLYVVRLNLDAIRIGRDEVIRRLSEAGIGTSVHFIPLHLHPHYQRRYGYRPGDFPVAEQIFERSISLPIWPGCSVTAARMATMPYVNAVRPGTYVFGDLSLTVKHHVMEWDDLAATVLSTVVDLPETGLALLDAGSKTLSGDKTSAGLSASVLDGRDIHITRCSEEHGWATGPDVQQLKIGEKVRLVPAHVCPVLNLTDEVRVVRDGKAVGAWKVAGRGKVQ